MIRSLRWCSGTYWLPLPFTYPLHYLQLPFMPCSSFQVSMPLLTICLSASSPPCPPGLHLLIFSYSVSPLLRVLSDPQVVLNFHGLLCVVPLYLKPNSAIAPVTSIAPTCEELNKVISLDRSQANLGIIYHFSVISKAHKSIFFSFTFLHQVGLHYKTFVPRDRTSLGKIAISL